MEKEENSIYKILKKLAIVEVDYVSNKLNRNELANAIKTLRREYEKYHEDNSDKKVHFQICIAILLERIKQSILLEDHICEVVDGEYESYMHYLNETIQTIKGIGPLENTLEYEKINQFNSRLDQYSANNEKTKQKRSNYPKQISRILKGWLKDNINNPYPTEDEKILLCDKTGLDQTQINNWFINARRRILPSMKGNRGNDF
ncbi:Homeobox protein HD-2 [Astathelohania contejeani]|uniref:Homeobox protein HD-2 n=1 Tax=Astathelohania contejeani TaxID=164912 RepID=A0ABQ7HYX6_9MICR|nr:Homeobox protein HD-2 [Thelohania contejeani]